MIGGHMVVTVQSARAIDLPPSWAELPDAPDLVRVGLRVDRYDRGDCGCPGITFFLSIS
jgi:hypothetical protein